MLIRKRNGRKPLAMGRPTSYGFTFLGEQAGITVTLEGTERYEIVFTPEEVEKLLVQRHKFLEEPG